MAPPRRTFEGYLNAAFGIFMWGSFAIFSWTILPSAFYFSSLAEVWCVKLGGLVEIGKRTPLRENGAKWNIWAAKHIGQDKRMVGIIIREDRQERSRLNLK